MLCSTATMGNTRIAVFIPHIPLLKPLPDRRDLKELFLLRNTNVFVAGIDRLGMVSDVMEWTGGHRFPSQSNPSLFLLPEPGRRCSPLGTDSNLANLAPKHSSHNRMASVMRGSQL
jgi:hypothetical protein